MPPAAAPGPGSPPSPDPTTPERSAAPTRAARRAEREAAATSATPRVVALARSPIGVVAGVGLALALVAALVLALTGPGTTPRAASAQRPATSGTPAAGTDSAQVVIDAAPSDTALSALGSLPVIAPTTAGYDRQRFGPPWKDVDGNGCDQRNDTLRRDLTRVTLAADGCVVTSGSLLDPLSETTVPYAVSAPDASVAVTTVVSLRDAWASGASAWSDATRTRFANDAVNLMAVSVATSRAREASPGGRGDASAWLPSPPGARCTYVARQVAVKVAYALGVSAAERRAMAGVLQTCSDVTLASVTPAPFGSPSATSPVGPPTSAVPTTATSSPPPVVAVPTPHPTPPPSTSPPGSDAVRPGSACSPVGATAIGTNGKLMRCTLGPNDVRPRWRTA